MSDARTILKRVGLYPKKGFGQNFLVSSHVVEAIARACVPEDEVGTTNVIELGAGLGVLTNELATRARHVIAVERDRDLVPVLHEELSALIGAARVTIVEGDAQAIDPASLFAGIAPNGGEPARRVLAGNLPYQITGRLIERAVNHASVLDRVVFMVQLEVADRLTALPGTKAYGALTVFTRAAFRVRKLFDVSAGSFFPAPEVTSAVVLLEPERPAVAEESPLFRALVKGAFGTRRKTLRNSWSRVASPEQIAAAASMAEISLDARGETLAVDAFARMAHHLAERLGASEGQRPGS